jgi:hypothetical protein
MNDTLTSEFSDRLITLADGRAGIRGSLHVEIREPGERSAGVAASDPQPILDFIASDETLDRYGEIIVARGWQLDNYRCNPVFQNAHQYGDVIFTLGKALMTEVRDGRLYQRVEFATEVNPMARIAYGLYKGKFLNGSNAIKDFRRKYIEQELLEVSAVGIPANPNALALGLKSGAIEKADLRELNDLIRQTLGDTEQWEEVPIRVQEKGRTEKEQLLKLAREVRDTLRRV